MWRSFPERFGITNYEVSFTGKIRNKKTKLALKQTKKKFSTKVSVLKDFEISKRQFDVGYLVAEIFVKNPEEWLFITFKDGNIHN